MASTRRPPPTYHVVPRFDIAAKGGAIGLGTVVDNLLMLRPLNPGEIVPIPENLRYTPVTHAGFTETRSRLREGHCGIWAKALACQGASADASVQHESQATVTCEAIVTTYFDPDAAYVAQSLAVRGVSDHFIGSGYEDDVYLITGLKVAKKLRYGSTTSTQLAGDASVATQAPSEGIQLGAKAGSSGNKGDTVAFEVDDIVVGFRVRRYAYVPASWNPFSKKKKLKGEDYLKKAEMQGEGRTDTKEPEPTYEQLPIPEEQDAQAAVGETSEPGEHWVHPLVRDNN
jgi:hypothetical protein